MSADTTLTFPALRVALTALWDRLLNIEPNRDGFLFTMPASFPDGWQMVLEISQKTPKGFRLSDQGRTLGWLAGQGQNVETEAIEAHVKRISGECGMRREGYELVRWLEAPLDATEIQVFTEGLIGISQLHLLHDPRAIEENVAETVVRRVFQDAGMTPERNHRLYITKERKIRVDFYQPSVRPVAVQLLRTKNDVTGKMEQWGFRWRELKKSHEGLMPVMLYDRSTQMIDSYCRHIGEAECELFCGFDETDRIHDVLKKAR
jgi:hypothetical protein